MRILKMSCAPVGPLTKPVFFQPEKPCTVICDENEAGKTTLVDIFVNLLFRKNSAQARFQSKRYEEFQGIVKIEHNGQEIEFKGSLDLDNFLGIPPEFSKLPVVRGSDLAFLWSDRREKKAPLINACLQYFTASREKNLETVMKNLRSEAGLPPKTNSWSQARLKEIEVWLHLYRNKEIYLSYLSQKERLTREIKEREQELASLRRQIAADKERLNLLAKEEEAARATHALGLFSGLEQLLKQFRENNFSCCTYEDAGKWAKLEGEKQTFAQRLRQLKLELLETESLLAEQRRHIADLTLKLEPSAAICRRLREELEKCQAEANHKHQVKTQLTRELQDLVASWETAGAVKTKKIQRILLASCCFAIFGFFFFLQGNYLGGYLFLALFLGGLLGCCFLGVSAGGLEQEILSKAKRIFQECGLSLPHHAGELLPVFEVYCQKETEKNEQQLERKKQGFVEEEQIYGELLAEKDAKEQKLAIIEETWKRINHEALSLEKSLSGIEASLADLQAKTSLTSLQALEASLEARVVLEKEISCTKAKIELCLGSEDEWPRKLAEARELLQKFPQARSLEEIVVLNEELMREINSLQQREAELLSCLETLKEKRLETTGRLQASGCENLSELARRLEEARGVLKENVRKALATIWVQRVLEKAKESLEDVLVDPLSRAAVFFEAITERYTAVTYTRHENDMVFKLCCSGQEYSEDVLSDGTRAQFLFSLRLALLEKLFAEETFLVLDDPLLHSSDNRKRRAIKVLLGLAEKGWQIIYLTIDSNLAKAFQESGGDLVSVCGVKDLLAQE